MTGETGDSCFLVFPSTCGHPARAFEKHGPEKALVYFRKVAQSEPEGGATHYLMA